MNSLGNGNLGDVLESGAVRFTRLLPGPIERVWDYLTKPELRAKWFADGPLEQRQGGKAELEFHNSRLAPGTPVPEKYLSCEGLRMPLDVLACEPPRLLSYTWGDSGSEVTFELAPEGNKVHLVLTHRKLASRDAMVNVSSGWHSHVSLLIALLEGSEPKNFWHEFLELEKIYEQRIQ